MGMRVGYARVSSAGQKLDIQLESVVWKSKRGNRVQIDLKITDPSGAPAATNLNATCTQSEQSCNEYCDIRNYLYFGSNPQLTKIDLSMQNDSVFTLINNILIAHENHLSLRNHSVNQEIEDQTTTNSQLAHFDEPVIAEINVSSNYSANPNQIAIL